MIIGLHARLQQKAQYVFKCLKTTGKFAKRLTNTRSLIIKIAVKSIERRKKEKDKNLTKRSFPFYINLRSTCSKNRVWMIIGLHARLQQKAQYVFKCLKTTGKFAKRLTNTRSLIIKIAVKSIERRKKEKDKNCRIPMTRRSKFTTSIIPLVNHVSYGSKCIVVNGISGKNFGLW